MVTLTEARVDSKMNCLLYGPVNDSRVDIACQPLKTSLGVWQYARAGTLFASYEAYQRWHNVFHFDGWDLANKWNKFSIGLVMPHENPAQVYPHPVTVGSWDAGEDDYLSLIGGSDVDDVTEVSEPLGSYGRQMSLLFRRVGYGVVEKRYWSRFEDERVVKTQIVKQRIALSPQQERLILMGKLINPHDPHMCVTCRNYVGEGGLLCAVVPTGPSEGRCNQREPVRTSRD